jgi:DNA (cytosine-5)-methyltransferase 1
MTKFKEWDIGTIDLLVGGTPCQSFSVAGLRKGLEDPRGNLALTYVGILDKFRPKWFVWENVPGVLSSGSGRDFGSFLGAVGKIGYGFAYRVLDAQYFGVAQRRRRVFVVGCLGDWRSAAEILFESHSLSGNPAPSREKGQAVAGTIAARFGISRNNHEECVAHVAPTVTGGAPFSRTGNERVECDAIIPVSDPAYCLETTCNDYSRADGFNMIAQPIPIHDQATRHAGKHGDKQDGKGNGLGIGEPGAPMNTLTKGDRHAVAHAIPLDLRNAGRDPEKYDAINRQGVGVGEAGDPAHTITSAFVHGVAHPIAFNPVSATLKGGSGERGYPDPSDGNGHSLVAHPTVLMDQGGSVMSVMEDGTVGTLRRETHGHEPVVMQPIAFTTEQTPKFNENQALTLTKSEAKHNQSVLTEMAVRRLTPVECERLQGFPDGYTNIPWRKKDESPDGPRYKSLGNSMAVPVMAWIGKRIANAS